MPDPDAEIQAIRVILPRPQNFRINVLGGGAQGTPGPPGPGASVTSTQIHNLVNTVSSRAVSISNELGSLLASTSAALESHINAVSAAGGGAGSMTSNEISVLVQIASIAATNAETHANAVSVRAVSISNELGSLLASASLALETHINAVSAAGVTGGASVTSQELSVRVQTASAAATSADAHANTVSVRAVSISAELASLIQIASTAATSADAHANTVSARAVSISNELGSLLASASLALETHINAVSAAGVTGGASVTSQELSVRVQTASAAATSADTHANTVSSRAASISNELGSLLASTSAALETHINAVSAAVTGGGGPINADAPNSTLDVAVASASAVTLVSKSITYAAGDQVTIKIWGSILNNSGSNKTYTILYNWGSITILGVFASGVTPSATTRTPVYIEATFSVNSTSSAWLMGRNLANSQVTLGGTSGALVLNLCQAVMEHSASNLTGSQTTAVKMYSSTTSITQSFELMNWNIQKTATNP